MANIDIIDQYSKEVSKALKFALSKLNAKVEQNYFVVYGNREQIVESLLFYFADALRKEERLREKENIRQTLIDLISKYILHLYALYVTRPGTKSTQNVILEIDRINDEINLEHVKNGIIAHINQLSQQPSAYPDNVFLVSYNNYSEQIKKLTDVAFDEYKDIMDLAMKVKSIEDAVKMSNSVLWGFRKGLSEVVNVWLKEWYIIRDLLLESYRSFVNYGNISMNIGNNLKESIDRVFEGTSRDYAKTLNGLAIIFRLINVLKFKLFGKDISAYPSIPYKGRFTFTMGTSIEYDKLNINTLSGIVDEIMSEIKDKNSSSYKVFNEIRNILLDVCRKNGAIIEQVLKVSLIRIKYQPKTDELEALNLDEKDIIMKIFGIGEEKQSNLKLLLYIKGQSENNVLIESDVLEQIDSLFYEISRNLIKLNDLIMSLGDFYDFKYIDEAVNLVNEIEQKMEERELEDIKDIEIGEPAYALASKCFKNNLYKIAKKQQEQKIPDFQNFAIKLSDLVKIFLKIPDFIKSFDPKELGNLHSNIQSTLSSLFTNVVNQYKDIIIVHRFIEQVIKKFTEIAKPTETIEKEKGKIKEISYYGEFLNLLLSRKVREFETNYKIELSNIIEKVRSISGTEIIRLQTKVITKEKMPDILSIILDVKSVLYSKINDLNVTAEDIDSALMMLAEKLQGESTPIATVRFSGDIWSYVREYSVSFLNSIFTNAMNILSREYSDEEEFIKNFSNELANIMRQFYQYPQLFPVFVLTPDVWLNSYYALKNFFIDKYPELSRISKDPEIRNIWKNIINLFRNYAHKLVPKQYHQIEPMQIEQDLRNFVNELVSLLDQLYVQAQQKGLYQSIQDEINSLKIAQGLSQAGILRDYMDILKALDYSAAKKLVDVMRKEQIDPNYFIGEVEFPKDLDSSKINKIKNDIVNKQIPDSIMKYIQDFPELKDIAMEVGQILYAYKFFKTTMETATIIDNDKQITLKELINKYLGSLENFDTFMKLLEQLDIIVQYHKAIKNLDMLNISQAILSDKSMQDSLANIMKKFQNYINQKNIKVVNNKIIGIFLENLKKYIDPDLSNLLKYINENDLNIFLSEILFKYKTFDDFKIAIKSELEKRKSEMSYDFNRIAYIQTDEYLSINFDLDEIIKILDKLSKLFDNFFDTLNSIIDIIVSVAEKYYNKIIEIIEEVKYEQDEVEHEPEKIKYKPELQPSYTLANSIINEYFKKKSYLSPSYCYYSQYDLSNHTLELDKQNNYLILKKNQFNEGDIVYIKDDNGFEIEAVIKEKIDPLTYRVYVNGQIKDITVNKIRAKRG